jgi:hypothetical protein
MTPEIRDELVALQSTTATELEEMRKALPSLETESASCSSAERLASAEHRDREKAVAGIKSPEEPLRTWLRESQIKRDAARGKKTCASRCLEEARRKIRDAELALAQIEQLIAPKEAAGEIAWGYSREEEAA